MTMTVQAGLAERVAALRRRLEELDPEPPGVTTATHPLADRLHELLDQILALKGDAAGHADLLPFRRRAAEAPAQLTWRAQRLLLRGRDLLEQLKTLSLAANPDQADHDPLAGPLRGTLAMTDLALRAVQAFPDGAEEQLTRCDGVEALLNLVGERVEQLRAMHERRRADQDRLEALAAAFTALLHGRPVAGHGPRELAEALLDEAERGWPLRLLHVGGDRPELWAAAHAGNVAQVMARLVRGEPAWRSQPVQPVLAALLADCGMAALPPELMVHAGPLSDEQRRAIESHVGLSADAARRVPEAESWIVDAIRAHHERLDGTGYPAGAQGVQVPRLARLLAVCDVYAAFSSPRAHRPALPPRAALTETLLEAEKGRLDPEAAERLLALSFYPVGTVVELSDGALGQVVALHPAADANPARPVVQLLAGADGRPLAWHEHANLAQPQGRHIVRSLPLDECRKLLGPRHWRLLL